MTGRSSEEESYHQGTASMSTASTLEDSCVFEDEIGVSPSPSQKFANVSVPYRALVGRSCARSPSAG